MLLRRSLAALVPGLLATLGTPAPLRAQSGPAIRLIVPFPPGGASDTAARIVGLALGRSIGRNVVVENRPGAGGLIGGEALVRSTPDGSVLGLSNIAPQGIAPIVAPNPPYDPVRDFTHIALVAETPSVMVVIASSPFHSIADYVAAAKRQAASQRGLTYASSGIGSPSHLQGELLSQLAGVPLTHVPYRGNAPGLQDLLAGQVDVMLSPLAGLTGAISAGQIRVIGVTAAERFSYLPDSPTFAEQGYPAITITSWTGISGPAGMPPALTAQLNTAINEAISRPEVKAQLVTAGQYPPQRLMDSGGFTAMVAAFPTTWAPVIKAANIRPD